MAPGLPTGDPGVTFLEAGFFRAANLIDVSYFP